MKNWDDDAADDGNAPDDEMEERLAQIGLFVVELRDTGPFGALSIERAEEMARSWLPALDGVPDEELARRDVHSIYGELARREKYTAGAVAELWAARQGNSARAQLKRDKAQAREDEFAQPQPSGPGHAALMAIGAALGYRAPGVMA